MDLALFVYSLVGELTLSLHIFSFNGLQHWMFWSASAGNRLTPGELGGFSFQPEDWSRDCVTQQDQPEPELGFGGDEACH